MNLSIKIDQSSFQQVVDALQVRSDLVVTNAYGALVEICNKAADRAANSCPIDTGTLRSAQFNDVAMEDNVVEAIIGYGGPNNTMNIKTHKYVDDYAAAVHEGWALSSKSRKAGATSKWLEKTVDGYIPMYLPSLQQYMAGALEALPMEETLEMVHEARIEVAEARAKRHEEFVKNHPRKRKEDLVDVFERRYRKLHPEQYHTKPW